ncbi:MAG TPA: DUF951 domain-containing protein [Anaerolineae bacterium]|nr:DUF951 domain-containing protein [Anaerolineae bacterium]
MPVELRLGDVVCMRKSHPCGGYEWEVVRLGADIGIRCLTCGHRVLMPRRNFERRMKAFVRRAEATSDASPAGETGSLSENEKLPPGSS